MYAHSGSKSKEIPCLFCVKEFYYIKVQMYVQKCIHMYTCKHMYSM